MGRKRQRDEDDVVPVDESESAQEPEDGSTSQTGDDEPAEERGMELDVWEAFKEEHHEVLEQLPLSLHRQFKLMRELDFQSEVFHAELLASVRRYVQLRQSLAPPLVQDVQPDSIDVEGSPIQVDSTEPPHETTVNGAVATPPPTFLRKPGETTRTLLQHVAQTSEEAIRTAEEKVSIAQTAYETVDRHIRLLDQAIKEQEAAISLGVRPGTHLAPILLPDLVVPRWARPPRVEHSPVPSLSPEPGLYVEEPPVLELPPPPAPSPKVPKKGKKAAAPKPTPEKEEMHPPVVAIAGDESARTRRASVRLMMPAHPEATEPTVPADPNEDRYCYCNQVSFGTMIACDNKGCCTGRGWFHLGCTGLLEVPSKKTKWYCRECKPKMTQKGRSKA